MIKKKLPFIHQLFFLAILVSLFVSFSGSPPLGRTGAPGDSVCNTCHNPAGAQTGTLDITGIPSNIIANQTYNVGICITLVSGTSSRAGFQFVALDGNIATSGSAGTISNLGTNVGMGVSGNRTYARHSGEKSYTGNKITYEFDWTAPSTAPDNVSFYATALIGNGSGSGGDLVVFDNIQDVILPVDLIDFTATDTKKGIVEINWATASEVNSDYFELLRSNDGVDFYPLEKINAAGNSTELVSYAYQDTDPIINRNSFYRLKQYDFNGKFYYSDIVTIHAKDSDASFLNVFPNPASRSGCLFIDYYAEQDFPNATCEILDMYGRSIVTDQQLVAGLQKGLNKLVIDLSDKPVGNYIFRIYDNNRILDKSTFILAN